MPLRPDSIRTDERPACGWSTGFAYFRSYLLVICFILMAGAVGINLLKSTIHNQLRDQIVVRLQQRLDGTPFRVKLADARWREGKGLSLSGLRILDSRNNVPIVEVQSAFAASTFQLSDFISLEGTPKIDLVTIEKAKVSLIQDNGDWTVQQLVKKLKECDLSGNCTCPIEIRDSAVTIAADSNPTGRPIRVAGINLQHSRQPDNPLIERFIGFMSAPLAGRLDIDVTINRETGIWEGTASAGQINLNESINKSIAQWVGQHPILESIRGKIAINAAATGFLDQADIPQFRILGQAADLQCLSDQLPHQIHDGRFRFDINNQRVVVSDAHCRIGYGTISARFQVDDPINDPKWRLVGKTTDFELTERLEHWLPEKEKKAWHQFQPQGVFDADFEFHNLKGKLARSLSATVKDVSVSWYRFPFRISQANGRVDLVDNHVSMDLVAVEAQQSITIRGEIDNPGKEWTGWTEAECTGRIPINEKLLAAFDVKPNLARTLRKFNSSGHVSGWGRLERVAATQKPKRDFRIRLHNTTVRHENFDYPIYNVQGLVLVENDQTFFQDISGVNNNGLVKCNGMWDRISGLRLKFLANRVALNEELRQALPPNFQRSWRSLRPVGTVDEVDWDFSYRGNGAKPESVLAVRILPNRRHTGHPSDVAITPVWFPYEMRNITGEFTFEGNRIGIKHFAARHGRTSINSNGIGSFDANQWRMRFTDLLVTDIFKDAELMAALPKPIRKGWESMQFDGNLNMSGIMEASGQFPDSNSSFGAQRRPADAALGVRQASYIDHDQIRENPNMQINWDLQIGIGAGQANLGAVVRNAHGALRLSGAYGNGNVFAKGLLSIDSMTVNDVQVHSFAAPISIDTSSIGLGDFAKTGDPRQPNATSATGQLFGGYIECDSQIQLDGNNEYFLQVVLTDAKLNEFAMETSMQQHDFSGQAFGKLQLYGDTTGPHSMRGNGQVQLRNAKIYEVPVMIALLNVLRIKEPDRTAFDQGRMDFTINGENIDFQKIELNGNAISLIGAGTVNLDREVDLDFYTMAGRNRWFIPIVTRLYQAGSQQVWWIEVDGSLDKPETNHEVLPGLNDSLKALFPELAKQETKR